MKRFGFGGDGWLCYPRPCWQPTWIQPCARLVTVPLEWERAETGKADCTAEGIPRVCQGKFINTRVLGIPTVKISIKTLLSKNQSRVPGVFTRDCAGRPNNNVPRRSKMSAIDVTAKAICERLRLIPLKAGVRQFAPCVSMPHVPTPPPLTGNLQLFFDCPIIQFNKIPGVPAQEWKNCTLVDHEWFDSLHFSIGR